MTDDVKIVWHPLDEGNTSVNELRCCTGEEYKVTSTYLLFSSITFMKLRVCWLSGVNHRVWIRFLSVSGSFLKVFISLIFFGKYTHRGGSKATDDVGWNIGPDSLDGERFYLSPAMKGQFVTQTLELFNGWSVRFNVLLLCNIHLW